MGLSLKEIGRLLDDESADFAEALNTRRAQLEERRQRLDAAIAAIRQAGLIGREQRKQIIKVIALNRGMATFNPDSQLAQRIDGGVREWGARFAERHSTEEIER